MGLLDVLDFDLGGLICTFVNNVLNFLLGLLEEALGIVAVG